MKNLTVDSGKGNLGAIGVRFYANNQGGMHHVHIRSGDGKGVIGLDLGYTGDQGPMIIRNIRVTGFDTGIHTKHGTASVTAEHITLENQNVVGWMNQDQPISLRDFKSTNAVTALENRGNTLINLLDADLAGTGAASGIPAIINDTGMLARNIKTKGYLKAIGGDRAAEGTNIAEWTSHPPMSTFPSPPRPLNLTAKETPDIVWDDPKDWVSVKKFAPTPDVPMHDQANRSKPYPDWTPALQQAIDSGATTVYFPMGQYTFNGTVKVRGKVQRIVGLNSNFGNLIGKLELVFEDGAGPIVQLEDFDWMYSNVIIRHVGKRTLVLNSLAGGQARGMGVSVIAEKGHGDLFVQDVTLSSWNLQGGNVWARQINPQGGYNTLPTVPRGTYAPGYDMILNDGATLWIWGMKTEGDGTPITTTNGGKTEATGFIYANKNYRPEKQWIVNDNSSVSVPYVENVIRQRPFDPVFEVRDGVTRILEKGVAPGRGGGSLVVLYTGYKGNATAKPAANKGANAKASGTSSVDLTWQDAATNEDGFVIEQEDGGKWKQVGTVGIDAAHFTVTRLAPETAYKFRVAAFNGAGVATAETVEAKTAVPLAPGKGTGLRAEYYGSKYFTGAPTTKNDLLVNFDWSQTPPDGQKPNDFAVRWTGEVEPRFSEDHTFQIESEGQRLWVNGELLIEAMPAGARARRATIALEAGKRVSIKLEAAVSKPGKVMLSWQSAAQALEPIPMAQLYPSASAQPEFTLSSAGTTVTEGKSLEVRLKRSREGPGPPPCRSKPAVPQSLARISKHYLKPSRPMRRS